MVSVHVKEVEQSGHKGIRKIRFLKPRGHLGHCTQRLLLEETHKALASNAEVVVDLRYVRSVINADPLVLLRRECARSARMLKIIATDSMQATIGELTNESFPFYPDEVRVQESYI